MKGTWAKIHILTHTIDTACRCLRTQTYSQSEYTYACAHLFVCMYSDACIHTPSQLHSSFILIWNTCLCIYSNERFGHSTHTFQMHFFAILYPSPFSPLTLISFWSLKNLFFFSRAVQERARKTNADDTLESGSRLAEISRKVLAIDGSLQTMLKQFKYWKRDECTAYSEKRTNVS